MRARAEPTAKERHPIARRPFFGAAPQKDDRRVNELITSPTVRVVDPDGEMLGVMTPAEAMAKAEGFGLDLVEISPNADPPVCKILDYGKFKYEDQKRKAEARKKQKTIDIKEIKMRPGIDEHDYDVKMRAMRRFLDEGDKVKVTLRFRGRELAHQELGLKVLNRVRDDVDEVAKVEQMPKMEGRQMIMVVAPAK
ncbi:MAG: translation initiation factor IF-3 [Alphaproteobacteria bacterium]|nr:translation initiation factor IF-3 [Alphaproteobacteria bacterium]